MSRPDTGAMSRSYHALSDTVGRSTPGAWARELPGGTGAQVIGAPQLMMNAACPRPGRSGGWRDRHAGPGRGGPRARLAECGTEKVYAATSTPTSETPAAELLPALASSRSRKCGGSRACACAPEQVPVLGGPVVPWSRGPVVRVMKYMHTF
jgi:hypothetical protein